MKYLGTISRIYLLLALTAAAALSPGAYLPPTAVLLLFNIYCLFAPPRPGLRLVATLLSLLILPLALSTAIGALPAAVTAIPAIPLLDIEIRATAQTRALPQTSSRRRPTSLAIALATVLLLVFVLSFALQDRALTYISSLLIAYLAGVALFILWRVPKDPLDAAPTFMRIVAGDTAQAEITLRARSRLPLLITLDTPYEWTQLTPSGPMMVRYQVSCTLAVTPPLAGPSRLTLLASAADPWGLIHTSQTLEPVELYVIPRARYAAWLAKRYLEQASPGTAASSVFPLPEMYRGLTKGVEYQESRPYQPGDRLKDIDWRHSLKLQQIITKEYREGAERTAVIVANLDAGDAEQADILAFNLITAVLTMAIEYIPTALVLYNHEKLLEVTRAENPRYAVSRALNLAQHISIYKSGRRFLAPPSLPRLRRALSQVKGLDSDPARRLMGILSAEYGSLQQAALNHQATVALNEAAKQVSPPALVAVLSLSADDTEALAVTLDVLKRRGYNYLLLDKA